MRILSFYSHPWKFLKAFFFDHEPQFGIQSKQSASLFNTARRMHAFNITRSRATHAKAACFELVQSRWVF